MIARRRPPDTLTSVCVRHAAGRYQFGGERVRSKRLLAASVAATAAIFGGGVIASCVPPVSKPPVAKPVLPGQPTVTSAKAGSGIFTIHWAVGSGGSPTSWRVARDG